MLRFSHIFEKTLLLHLKKKMLTHNPVQVQLILIENLCVCFSEMARRWCTLEGGFLSYYEKERSPSAIGRLDVTEVVSLAPLKVDLCDSSRAVFTIELYLRTERALTVGAETQDTQHDWILALTKVTPFEQNSELIGRLQYKEGHDLYHWRMGWFMLEGSTLHFSSGEEEADEEVLRLKQLQELTVSTHTEGEDRIQVLLLVESGRTLYIHGFNRMDFALWHSTITMAAGTDGRALGDQQLTKNGVPIIVDSCIAFVTQYGLCQKGVYQTPGDPARVSLLLEEFTRDARNVKLRKKEHKLEDVTDTLKSFLSHTEDALLTKELYPYWVSALGIIPGFLKKMTFFFFSIQKCSSHLNEMPSEKLAAVFSCCLFQTQGQTSQEINVIRDLISNYVTLFSVSKKQIDKTYIYIYFYLVPLQFCPAGDLIFEVYLERREPEQCCLIKLSPSMRSSELAEAALSMRNCTFKAEDMWTTFEVIENGELERPLHHKENILEQVLEWSALDCPSSAFLVLKKFAGAKRMFLKSDYLKFSDGSTKLLSGHKFQDKYVVLHSEKLLLYRDIKVSFFFFLSSGFMHCHITLVKTFNQLVLKSFNEWLNTLQKRCRNK
uniref:PH domain-containing protein n=1 Tax=Cyprinodon variegatus TaxID=28743 RepID=A0A3Q2DPN8_CYPVA